MNSSPLSRSGPRRVVLLGATGSIGRQACDVLARFPDRFTLVGVVAGRDVAALATVASRFHVGASAVVAPADGAVIPAGMGVGIDAACAVAAEPADVVVIAITGAAALRPTLAAVATGADIAIATKEVLVMAGDVVRARARVSGSRLWPVDSEHSALWQCLRGEDPKSIARLVLTASGGPFRLRDVATLEQATPAEALRHPNWNMGDKVTIDTATMMNKGLEVIEAHYLFDIEYSRIGVLIHPPSIVHSMVEFVDGATMAQMGIPDMRIPIALALAAGERLPGICPSVSLAAQPPLEFSEVDDVRFPAVALARRAGERGGVAPAVLNGANEAAVAAFLAGRLRFTEIVPRVAAAVDAAEELTAVDGVDAIDAILAADRFGREHVTERLRAAL